MALVLPDTARSVLAWVRDSGGMEYWQIDSYDPVCGWGDAGPWKQQVLSWVELPPRRDNGNSSRKKEHCMPNYIETFLNDLEYCVGKVGDAGHRNSLSEVRRYIKEHAPSASTNSAMRQCHLPKGTSCKYRNSPYDGCNAKNKCVWHMPQ